MPTRDQSLLARVPGAVAKRRSLQAQTLNPRALRTGRLGLALGVGTGLLPRDRAEVVPAHSLPSLGAWVESTTGVRFPCSSCVLDPHKGSRPGLVGVAPVRGTC